MMQDFLRTSEIGYALQEPIVIFGQSVMQVCTIVVLKEGISDVLEFTHEDIVFEIIPTIVRDALHLPIFNEFDAPASDEASRFFPT